MTDYWLSKLCFDLQDAKSAEAYRADRARFIRAYPLRAEIVEALMADDVAALAPVVNPYLLRFYFQNAGMPDAVFIRRIRQTGLAAANHG